MKKKNMFQHLLKDLLLLENFEIANHKPVFLQD